METNQQAEIEMSLEILLITLLVLAAVFLVGLISELFATVKFLMKEELVHRAMRLHRQQKEKEKAQNENV